MNYRIFPPEEMIDATISLPLSKSISNRALILNALTSDAIPLQHVAQCDDTNAMIEALNGDGEKVNVGAAGTAMRFLTAYYASKSGSVVEIDGSERMRQRPIKALVDALVDCGAKIEYLGEEGFPPLRIYGRQLEGGKVSLPASISSQYISALLMVAPLMSSGLTLMLDGEITSRPYILMTISMMREWGVDCDFDQNIITVPNGKYRAVEYDIEADWSAASYWYEISALAAGCISLNGLKSNSIQGDSQLVKYFTRLGVDSQFDDEELSLLPSPEQMSHIELDLSEQPDIAQTIAVTCCMLRIPFRLTGLSTLKIKETDRLEALKKELAKLSFDVEVEHDSQLVWDGGQHPVFEMPCIDTYDDHRMAMAFAPIALYMPGVIINNIEVVAKSYPEYWQHLAQAGFVCIDANEPIPDEFVETEE